MSLSPPGQCTAENQPERAQSGPAFPTLTHSPTPVHASLPPVQLLFQNYPASLRTACPPPEHSRTLTQVGSMSPGQRKAKMSTPTLFKNLDLAKILNSIFRILQHKLPWGPTFLASCTPNYRVFSRSPNADNQKPGCCRELVRHTLSPPSSADLGQHLWGKLGLQRKFPK